MRISSYRWTRRRKVKLILFASLVIKVERGAAIEDRSGQPIRCYF